VQNISFRNKTVAVTVATARREGGQRQGNQTGIEIHAQEKEKRRTPEEKMEGPAAP
jgi:hypothetical protein